MKKILYGFFLLIAIPGFSQQAVTISGTLTQVDAENIELVNDPLYLGEGAESIVSELKNGKFKFSLKIDAPRMLEVKLKESSRWVYLEPGDDLSMNIRTSLDEIILFDGKAAAHNQALQDLRQRFKDDFTDSLIIKDIHAKSVDLFEIDRFKQLQVHKEFVKTNPDKGKWSDNFSEYLMSHVRYNYLAALMAYPIESANKSRIPRVVPLPQIMLDPVTPELVNNADVLISSAYRRFLKYYITYEGSKMNNFDKFTDVSKSMEKKYEAAQANLTGEPFLYYVSSYLLEQGENARPGAVRRIHKALEAADKDNRYADIVGNVLGTHMALQDNEFAESTGAARAGGGGDPNEIFVLYDEAGEKVSMKSFKGKVVYVDFWASWCGPCRNQFPFAKKLKDRLSKKEAKQIVFLYVSMDKTEKAWKDALEKMQLEGTHTYSPSNWASKMAEFYRINSIPRYMLINKKGDVVDPNAKRPSDPDIYDELIKLIGQ